MAKPTIPIRVISFVLLAACWILCQKPPPADGLRGLRPQMLEVDSLPDAPSAVNPPKHEERFRTFVNASGSPSTPGAIGVDVIHETRLGYFIPGPQRSLTAPYQAAVVQDEPNAFLGKYLYPPLLKQDTRYYASTSESFMGRASYAASRIFVTHDDSGKARLNTRYFLGVLSSVAMHAAYRPYWARSTSETFNNFGSTIGGDAGINVFHEFRPGIRQIVKGLTPKFVSRIEERITHDLIPK